MKRKKLQKLIRKTMEDVLSESITVNAPCHFELASRAIQSSVPDPVMLSQHYITLKKVQENLRDEGPLSREKKDLLAREIETVMEGIRDTATTH